MKKSLLSMLLISNAYMSDPADSAGAEPVAAAEGVSPVEAAATVTLDVPAEHASLLQRALALLERGESYIKDNIEAGITHFEALFKDDDNNVGG